MSNKKNELDTIKQKIQNQEEILIKLILEDEISWLNRLIPDIELTIESFFEQILDGTVLCRLANHLQEYLFDYCSSENKPIIGSKFKFFSKEKLVNDTSKFKSRENIAKFIGWCRNHKLPSEIMFESNDVINANKESRRRVIICLLEVARRFRHLNIPLPQLIKFELQIERRSSISDADSLHFQSSSVTQEFQKNSSTEVKGINEGNDIAIGQRENSNQEKKNTVKEKSSSEMVLNLTQAEIIQQILDQYEIQYASSQANEGTFLINGKKRFIRFLNNQFVIRVGGGWDTVESFLSKNFVKKVSPPSNPTDGKNDSKILVKDSNISVKETQEFSTSNKTESDDIFDEKITSLQTIQNDLTTNNKILKDNLKDYEEVEQVGIYKDHFDDSHKLSNSHQIDEDHNKDDIIKTEKDNKLVDDLEYTENIVHKIATQNVTNPSDELGDLNQENLSQSREEILLSDVEEKNNKLITDVKEVDDRIDELKIELNDKDKINYISLVKNGDDRDNENLSKLIDKANDEELNKNNNLENDQTISHDSDEEQPLLSENDQISQNDDFDYDLSSTLDCFYIWGVFTCVTLSVILVSVYYI